ncbi:hypothetical protein [Microbacterium forte]|uniref:hypothetical protein n=1 Tax=Microbacterium forte TaxID=2982533 RepID=UPI0028935893|nr:hypothetical protein [Microbacterium sp. A(2022)]
MDYAGVVPMDAPDPSADFEARLRGLSYPVFQLRPQPSLTRIPGASFMEMGASAAAGAPMGLAESSVSLTYTLWRNPDDHSDPRNEIELDPGIRRSIEEEPPWGRPAWLIERAQLLKYPMLWEAVRTSWQASPDPERHALSEQLVDHANHILRNRFREELGLPDLPSEGDDGGWEAKTSAARDAVVAVDGRNRPGVQIDTDPFVYAVGFRVDENVVCTVVVPRDSLPTIDLAITTFE